MQLNYYSAVIFVEDIERSKRFYEDLLQLNIEHDFGKNVTFKGGLSIWELRENHIVPEQLKGKLHKQGNRFELYLETKNIAEVHAELSSNNVQFLHEIHEEPWGQQTIRFFDPDGHLIEIGETLQTFVKRMKTSGMDVEEIIEKTNIPKETVLKLLNL